MTSQSDSAMADLSCEPDASQHSESNTDLILDNISDADMLAALQATESAAAIKDTCDTGLSDAQCLAAYDAHFAQPRRCCYFVCVLMCLIVI